MKHENKQTGKTAVRVTALLNGKRSIQNDGPIFEYLEIGSFQMPRTPLCQDRPLGPICTGRCHTVHGSKEDCPRGRVLDRLIPVPESRICCPQSRHVVSLFRASFESLESMFESSFQPKSPIHQKNCKNILRVFFGPKEMLHFATQVWGILWGTAKKPIKKESGD